MRNELPYHSTEALVSDFRNGKEAALEAVYKLHARAVLHFAYKIIQDETIADEIVAESFLRLWNKRTKLETVKGLIGYLYAIARNLCYQYQNEEKKRKEVLDEFGYLENQEVDPICEEMRSRLLQAIYLETQQMPEQMKKVFTLAYLEGMLAPAIAQELAVSVNTVQTHKKAALKRMRTALAKKGFTKWSYLVNLFFSWLMPYY